MKTQCILEENVSVRSKCIEQSQSSFTLRSNVELQDPDIAMKMDIERFIWNFLASRTASGPVAGSAGEPLRV